MFKKDTWLLGMAIGAVLPVVIYGLTILVLSHWDTVVAGVYTPNPKTPGLVGIAANLLVFRYFMVNMKHDKTGSGLLIITFVLVLLLFIFL